MKQRASRERSFLLVFEAFSFFFSPLRTAQLKVSVCTKTLMQDRVQEGVGKKHHWPNHSFLRIDLALSLSK